MSEQAQRRVPTEINLHSKSRLLVIAFEDGRRFELPCEYLRVFSRAKEVRTMAQPVIGKESVNITQIEPQGQYALRLVFDDGHDTGIYSWETLYELGEQQEQNWQAYLQKLAELGVERNGGPGESAATRRSITLLYFTYLVKQLRRASEPVELPSSVEDVQSLIAWLRKRDPEQAHLFTQGSIQITVNKQFSKPFTRLDDGDEVALVPTSPVAPVAE